ncbi:MFS general substrate transporter [Gonapodya prolifera JEL478]|uniref:MFS general substrate transporter n=1 Tax=Gonapodya prolifera (strain JEL478) TaxID=1344416 RepID=A0A139AM91_GONPJ|nr:MFS general substrate transporter [Gonapodya prolifera JEL478]|eukprot:KXS17887.1 MFS general substrate transporter [Gonapodya prolifera JEL478]
MAETSSLEKDVAKPLTDAKAVDAPKKKSFVSLFWDADYDTKSPLERSLVNKIDLGILIYATLGYFVKTLDQQNINNAFLSGMREDLNMYGNELNYAVLAFNVPYCVLAIPSNILLTKIRPSLYLPIIELCWSILTIAKGFVHNYQTLYVLQFFIGAFEAGYFPGVVYLIGSWYTNSELSKRFAIFSVTSAIGAMFSGYLQTAVYVGLNGSAGLSGWKWLFVVDGLISVVSAVVGFFLIPDFPETTKWKLFTPDEIELAKTRLNKDGKQGEVKYSWDLLKRVFGRWHWYLFTILYAIYNSASSSWGYLGFLLKFGGGFTVEQINLYPTGVNAVTAFFTFFWGWYADHTQNRYLVIVLPMTISAIFVTILAVWDVPFGLKFASYFFAAVSTPISNTMAYLSTVVDKDPVERTLIIGSMNSASYTIFIIGQLVFWPTTSAPSFPVGYKYTATSLWVGLIVVTAIRYLWKRDLARGIIHTPEGTFVRKVSESKEDGELETEKIYT